MKGINKLVVAVAVVGCLAGSASALQLKVGTGYGPYQTGQGGEFSLAVVSGTLDLSGYSSAAATQTRGLGVNANSFQTFCIEDSIPAEYIYQNQIMDAVQSATASYGSQPPLGDAISVGTGWLYSQFASGIWVSGLSYDYTNPGRSRTTGSAADLLQQAIWLLENEITSANNMYVTAVTTRFGSLANAQADDVGSTYGVYAMNLTFNGAHRQDQLYYDGSHRVPDGGMTLALAGLAMAGLAAFRRRIA